MPRSSTISSLWLIGCGNMGGALLARWVAAGAAAKFVVVDPAMPKLPRGVAGVASLGEAMAIGRPDVVVIAVKPQMAAAALAGFGVLVAADCLTVSIMAGPMLADIARMTGTSAMVRAMPNTPAAIGKGVCALYGSGINDAQRVKVERLFAAAGTTLWLDAEVQFDAVTALSGSGPAYVFRFIEALAAAGEAAGLSPELSAALARQTVIGASALADLDARSAAELRTAVTSPGGTTEAGLNALDSEPGLPALLRAAVRAATARSRELAELAQRSDP
jgi:pyrroline-5-carboxylate reductase